MSVSDIQSDSNGVAAEFRRMAGQVKAVGKDRNTAFVEVSRLAAMYGKEYDREILPAILAVYGPLTAAPANPPPETGNGHAKQPSAPDVNQDNQENHDNQDYPRRTNDKHRKPTGGARGKKNPVGRTHEETFQHELENGLPSSLLLRHYMIRAYHAWRKADAQRTEWQSPLFYFLRLLKAHPDLAKASAKKTFGEIVKLVRDSRGDIPQDQRVKHDPDGWGYFFGLFRDDVEAEVMGVWDEIRYLPGFDPLDNAVIQAGRCLLGLRPEKAGRRPHGYQRFVSVAGWLQVAMGNRPILLPVEELANRLNVTPMTISRYRKWAKEDEYLVEVRPYKFHSKGGDNAATEFRFNVALWSCLLEPAQQGTAEGFEERS